MSRSRDDYEEIAVIRDPEGLGLVASITHSKRPNGYHGLSFAIFKEFERKEGAPVERSSFLNERHIDSAMQLLTMVRERMAAEREKAVTKRRIASR